jgi:hypothetical protein
VSLSAFDVGSKKKLWSRATTTVDQSLRSHPLGAGYRDLELDADGSTIWAACACDAVDGNPAKALVKLDTEGAHDASWVAEAGRQAFGISVVNTPDKLYLGAGGSDYLAEYPKADSCGNLTDGLIDWCWQRDTSGSTQAVEVMDGQLVVGGHFWEVADQVGEQCGSRSWNPDTLDPNDVCQTRKGLAAYTFDGVLDPNWDPVYSGKFNLVWALHVEGERLHTGGEFTTVSGIKQTNYARLSVDNTPPTLSAVSPADGTTDVALDANVEATFSEAIDSSTLTNTTFTLTKQDGTPEGTQVPATLSYNSSTNTATLNPEADLSSRASYTATIKGGTEGVKDSSGNPLANDEVWSIITTLECTIVGTSSAETLTGTSADDVICAGGGNDTIKGLEGNDTLDGKAGTDTCMTDATEKSIVSCER